MDTLLPYALAAGLFLLLEVLWARPSEAPRTAGDDAAGRSPSTMTGWDPTTLPFLRDRLDAVDAELERLEQDASIYARAFRYSVCKDARQDLLADLSRFAASYHPADGLRPGDVGGAPDIVSLEADAARSRASDWEEIDV